MKICHTCQQTYSDDVEFCPRDGARLAAQATATEAQLAAGLSRRFRLVRRLGQGGMGTVFLAQQIGVGNRPVALKVLNRKLLDDPDFLMRFQNEAGSTGRIRHSNVVTIYESGQADDGTPYIAMEFLEGESLHEVLKRRGALPVPEVAEILQQAARGLNAAHNLGIIHRDLKPDNIFLTYPDDVAAPLVGAHDIGAGLVPALPVGIADAGRAQDPPLRPIVVKVVDFGIAKLRESGAHTQTGTVLGTPAYMSFEQASGMRSDELDARSDVYSLGVVVYEMLTGRPPFQSDTPVGYLRMHMQEDPPPFRTVKPDLPALPQLESVVMKALTKSRDQRYGSVMEFARAFAEAADAPKAVVGAVREPPLRDRDTMLQPPAPPTTRHPISGTTGTAATKSRLPLWVGVPAAALALVLAGWYLSSVIHPRSGSPTQPATAKTPPAAVSTAVGTVEVNPKDGLKYVWIPPGTFMMGCSPGDKECDDNEKPPHQVTLTKGFWLGQTEVTVGAYKRFAGATRRQMPPESTLGGRPVNPGWGDEAMPIVDVTWDDAQAYCRWAGGRLPTEAEWEYAARAGSTAARYSDLDETAWYADNSGSQRLDSTKIWNEDQYNYTRRLNENGNGMHEVGQKRPNGFGLYDILGNVWEWVNDWCDRNYYQNSSPQDPSGPTSGQMRVLRGGGWDGCPWVVRGSNRTGFSPASRYDNIGFRCGGEVAGQKFAASQSSTAASLQPPKPASQPPDTKAQLAEGHFLKGNALFSKNDLDGAITEYREAIRLKPDLAETHYKLGLTLWKKGDIEGAIAEYRDAIRVKPDFAEHGLLGLALKQKGDLDGAIAEYREAIRLKPDFAETHYDLGVTLREKRDFDGAISEFREAIRLKPDFAEAHESLGISLSLKGDWDGMITEEREAIRLKPDNAEMHDNLGAALEQKGELQAALEEYRKAYELAPKNAAIRADYERLVKRLNP
jgi:serine/threonine-protein kinase